jgi:hypothetical protein
MHTILQVQQAIYQIQNIIINDDIMKKLLFIQSPEALTSAAVITANQVRPLVHTMPYITYKGGVENTSNSNFCVIYTDYINLQNPEMHKLSLSIDVFVHKDYYFLNGNKQRLLELVHRLIQLLDNKKLGFAEKLRISDVKIISLDDGKTIGYILSWGISHEGQVNF